MSTERAYSVQDARDLFARWENGHANEADLAGGLHALIDALSTPPADDVREALAIRNGRDLLDALDEISRPPFEIAVLDAHGRVGIAYADEDSVLGIQRLAYEDEPNTPTTVQEDDFPMIRLVPASQSKGRS